MNICSPAGREWWWNLFGDTPPACQTNDETGAAADFVQRFEAMADDLGKNNITPSELLDQFQDNKESYHP